MNTHSDVRLTSKLYYYAADVTEVYDGDTITVNLDLGLGVWRHGVTIRFWKVDTPELKGPDREKGLQVRDMVRDLVLNKSILLRTILDKRGEDRTGKFGRLLGEVMVANERGALINVNDLLLGLGLAVPMNEDGSHTVSPKPAARAAIPDLPIPAVVPCPFCGEERRVLHETTTSAGDVSATAILVEQCPNCLDNPRPLSELQKG